jgi:Flp pilus assembly protein TadD
MSPAKPSVALAGVAHRGLSNWVTAFALAALVFAAYSPVLQNGFVNWDDDRLLLDNPAVTSRGGLRTIWSALELPEGFPNYPLTYTSFWLEYRLWGGNPVGYHVTSVLLHCLNTVLVFFLSQALGLRRWWAALVAALFGLHPVQVESVAWIAERKNVLSGAFFLASFLAYERHRATPASRWYGLCLLLFAGALLSKTAAIVLPLSLLLVDRLRAGAWGARSVARIAPMLALDALAVAQTMTAEHRVLQIPLLDRLLVAATASWFYFYKLLVPTDLLPVYPRWHPTAASPLWWIAPLACATVFLALRFGIRDWRAQWGAGHYLCVLLPVLGLVSYGYNEFSFVADRNVYLASVGIFVVVAVGFEAAQASIRSPLLQGLAVSVLVALALLTSRQIPVWRDSVTLWRYDLAGNPSSVLARNNLGLALIERGDLAEAGGHLRAAVEADPTYPEARINLALALYRQRDFGAAEEMCRKALDLRPDVAEYHKDLGLILQARGRPADAEAEFRRAAELEPREAVYDLLVGDALVSQGKLSDSVDAYERALRLQPDSVPARNQLGRVLLALGRSGDAAERFARIVERAPSSAQARYNLAVALQRLGRLDEARAEVRQALRLQPEFGAARELSAQLAAGGSTDR